MVRAVDRLDLPGSDCVRRRHAQLRVAVLRAGGTVPLDSVTGESDGPTRSRAAGVAPIHELRAVGGGAGG